MIKLKNIIKNRTSVKGNLNAFDIPKNFIVKRIFLVNNVPVGTERGKHANKKSNQIIFCTSGKVELRVTKKGVATEKSIILLPGDHYVHEKMNWIEIEFFSAKGEICVLADQLYDSTEYITDFNEYKRLTHKK